MTNALRYGVQSSDGGAQSTENFPGAGLHPLSFACTPVQLLSNDGENTVISSASGFFWRASGRDFLVTNWHVLSGRDVFSGDLLSRQGFIPKVIQVFGVNVARNAEHVRISRQGKIITLAESFVDALSNARERGLPGDVALLDMPQDMLFEKGSLDPATCRGAQFASCFVNELANDDIALNVGDSCFILGYPPNHVYDGLMPPLWRHASIASEPLVAVDGRPIFYVDALTSEAMSGSPIIAKSGDRIRFIGIYGGRITGKDDVPAIGYGWYGSLIPKVLKFFGFT